MDPSRFVLRLLEPLPMLTGTSQLGDDCLVVQVGSSKSLCLVRVLPPNYAGLKEALELGRVELLNPENPPFSEVSALLAVMAARRAGGRLSPTGRAAPAGARPMTAAVHAYSIHEEVPSLGLQQGDVILIEQEADDPMALYRAVAIGYDVLHGLLERGILSASPSARVALTEMVGGRTNTESTSRPLLSLVP